MAFTRSEIELLIKARNEAKSTLDQLDKQINAVSGSSARASAGLDKIDKSTRKSSVGATGAGVAFGILAERLGTALVRAFSSTISAANRLDAGLIGLSSVAGAFGQDADKAKQAAIDLASDGLMSVGEAATALKNLLAAGFGLPDAITLVTRFKDTAAFGRQAALGFGQAITSATEGIKNGNSILVDNAGVTKNLSTILVEAGFSAQDLSKATSDVNVRQALFNGLVKETLPQLGDTERLLKTSAGAQAVFNAQIEISSQKIGKGLQPALGGALKVLTPMLKLAGDGAPVLIGFGVAIAGIVGPMVAARAAAALGIAPLGKLITTLKAGSALSFRNLKDGRASIQLLGGSAGITAKSLGGVGTAAAVMGVAIGAWTIGRWIANVFELDNKILGLANRMRGLTDEAAGSQDKLDQIALAVSLGADESIEYAEAIAFLNDRFIEMRGAVDDGVESQRALVEVQLKSGEITRAQADDLKILLRAQEIRETGDKNRIELSEAVRQAELKIQKEIRNTGLSLAELKGQLVANESVFSKWAESHGVSKDTLKALKDEIKSETAALKDQEKATKETLEAQLKLEEVWASMGLTTLPQLNEELDELKRLEKEAERAGIPTVQVATQLRDRYDELAAQALASGIQLDLLTEAQNRNRVAMRDTVTQVDVLKVQFSQLDTESFKVSQATLDLWEKQGDLADAFERTGTTSRAEMTKTRQQAEADFKLIAESGEATEQDLKAAWERVQEAHRAEIGQLPGFWETEIVPGVVNQLGLMQTATQGTFAQMLLGAKGFGDGFSDIWSSIKSSFTNILSQMLDAFLNTFIKGMISALSGGGFQQAFAGFLGGGGGGGGLLGGILGGLGGGGGAFVGPPAPGAAAGGGGFLGGLGGLLTGGPGLFGLGSLATGGLFGAGAFGLSKLIGAFGRDRGRNIELSISRGTVGQLTGAQISDDLKNALEDVASDLGDDFAAIQLNWESIFKDLGGVVALGLEPASRSVRDIFSAIQTGRVGAQEGMQAFLDVLDDLAPSFDTAGAAGQVQFLELIQLAQQFGFDMRLVRDIIGDELVDQALNTDLASAIDEMGNVISDTSAQAAVDIGTVTEAVNDLERQSDKSTTEIESSFQQTGRDIGVIWGELTDEMREKFRKWAESGIRGGKNLANELVFQFGVIEGAAGGVSGSIGGIAGSISEVQERLDGVDWDRWAEGAREAIDDTVEGIGELNFGESPGGLKEIPLLLREGVKQLDEFASRRRLLATIAEQIAVGAGPGPVVGPLTASGFAGAGSQFSLTVNVKTLDATGFDALMETRIVPDFFRRIDRNTAGARTAGQRALRINVR